MEITPEQIQELVIQQKNPSYFSQVNFGISLSKMSDELVQRVSPEQAMAYMLWSSLFHSYHMSMVLTKTAEQAKVMREELVKMTRDLPEFFLPATVRRTESMVRFENESTILFRQMNPCATRGLAANIIYMDSMDESLLQYVLPSVWNKGKVLVRA